MFNNLVYSIQTIYNIAFCYSVEELYKAMKHRSPREAILYSSGNVEDLLYMANIRQNYYCDKNSDENNVIHPIALPTVVNETVNLQNNGINNVAGTALVAYQQSGEWAVSGLNGFCTAANDEELCQILIGKKIAYPMARWCPLSHNEVVAIARSDYIKRFYSRYWYSAEQTSLPQMWLEEFLDDHFEHNVKNVARRRVMRSIKNFRLSEWTWAGFKSH